MTYVKIRFKSQDIDSIDYLSVSGGMPGTQHAVRMCAENGLNK